MTTPNLLALNTINVDTAILPLTTTETDIIANVATDHVFEVTAIFVSNIHDTVVPFVTIILKRGGVDRKLCNKMRVQTKAAPVNVLAAGRTIYLREGDSIRGLVDADNLAIAYVPFNDLWQCQDSPCP